MTTKPRSAPGAGGRATDLVGIASLAFEPLWIFARGTPPEQLGQLAGMRIQVGAEGSGTRLLAQSLLAANGLDAQSSTWLDDGPDDVLDSLLSDRADALLLISGAQAPIVRQLFEAADEGIEVVSLRRALGTTRHFPYLDKLVLPAGSIDLAARIPRSDVQVVATNAGLIARSDLHPAVMPLLIEAARSRLDQGSPLARPGEFPRTRGLDVPLATAAERFFTHGKSWLYRVLPFQAAAAVDRLKILLLPLLTLLFPLMRLAPPIYRWRIRSRIYRWYRLVQEIEGAATPEHGDVQAARAQLAALDREIAQVHVPLSYAEELYHLRLHIGFVREALGRECA